MNLTWFYYVVAAAFGLIFGSFFNVVIYRFPEDMSLGNRSICPNCGMTIRWYDNIPLLSYVVLCGHCRGCRTTISIRYPLVEALTSGLFVLMYWWSRSIVPQQVGVPPARVVTPELFIGLLMVCVLIVASAIDISHGIVPNRIMYPGLIAMLLLVTAVALYRGQPGRIGLALAGAAIGGGFLLGAGLLYGLLFLRRTPESSNETEGGDGNAKVVNTGLALGSEEDSPGDGEDEDEEDFGIPTGIGMGDVKLIVFCGLALGFFHWYLIIVQILVGFLLGALASIPLLILSKKGRRDRLPFAPFLAAGAVIALIWGPQLVDLYLRLIRHGGGV
jgi:leader peptidase (prepilin peptidase)/N-methyltransferase